MRRSAPGESCGEHRHRRLARQRWHRTDECGLGSRACRPRPRGDGRNTQWTLWSRRCLPAGRGSHGEGSPARPSAPRADGSSADHGSTTLGCHRPELCGASTRVRRLQGSAPCGDEDRLGRPRPRSPLGRSWVQCGIGPSGRECGRRGRALRVRPRTPHWGHSPRAIAPTPPGPGRNVEATASAGPGDPSTCGTDRTPLRGGASRLQGLRHRRSDRPAAPRQLAGRGHRQRCSRYAAGRRHCSRVHAGCLARGVCPPFSGIPAPLHQGDAKRCGCSRAGPWIRARCFGRRRAPGAGAGRDHRRAGAPRQWG